MKLIYHRSVQSDVSAVLAHYDEVGGPALGDAFFAELMAYVGLVIENTARFRPVDGDLRGPTSSDSRIIFSTGFTATLFVSLSCGTTSVTPITESNGPSPDYLSPCDWTNHAAALRAPNPSFV